MQRPDLAYEGRQIVPQSLWGVSLCFHYEGSRVRILVQKTCKTGRWLFCPLCDNAKCPLAGCQYDKSQSLQLHLHPSTALSSPGCSETGLSEPGWRKTWHVLEWCSVTAIICHDPNSVADLKAVWLQSEIVSGTGVLLEGSSRKNTLDNTFVKKKNTCRIHRSAQSLQL